MFINTAYAASESMDQFIMNVNKLIINPTIVLLFALALAYFLWGVFQFISNQDNEEAKTKGKSHMLWGVVGLTIMIAVFALLNIILKTFNINNINPEQGTVQLDNYNPPYPQVGQ